MTPADKIDRIGQNFILFSQKNDRHTRWIAALNSVRNGIFIKYCSRPHEQKVSQINDFWHLRLARKQRWLEIIMNDQMRHERSLEGEG